MKRSRWTGTRTHTRKLNRNISTLMPSLLCAHIHSLSSDWERWLVCRNISILFPCVCSCACPPWSLQFLVTVFTFLSLILYIDFLFQIDSAREFMQFPYLVDCLQELLGKWRAEVLCIDHGTQVSDNVCLCLDQLSVDVLLHWASELLGIVNLGGSMSNATFYCITN